MKKMLCLLGCLLLAGVAVGGDRMSITDDLNPLEMKIVKGPIALMWGVDGVQEGAIHQYDVSVGYKLWENPFPAGECDDADTCEDTVEEGCDDAGWDSSRLLLHAELEHDQGDACIGQCLNAYGVPTMFYVKICPKKGGEGEEGIYTPFTIVDDPDLLGSIFCTITEGPGPLERPACNSQCQPVGINADGSIQLNCTAAISF